MGTRRIESVTIALEAKDRTKGWISGSASYSLTKSIIRRSPGRRNRLKLISWNVNGIRACVQEGFLDFFHEADADIFCIQDEDAGRTVESGTEKVSSVLELCCEERLFRNSSICKKNHYRYPMDWGLKSMTRRDA